VTPAGERRDRNRALRVYVTSAERDALQGIAKSARLSVSDYLRSIGLGHEVQSAFDQEAVVALVRVAGDQARLGGLLKLWLTERAGEGASPDDVRRLLSDIEAATAEVRAKARGL
jgi:hypothetical protein